MIDMNDKLQQLLTATFLVLCGGTVVRIVALRHADSELAKKRLGSLRVWWVLTILLSLAVIFG